MILKFRVMIKGHGDDFRQFGGTIRMNFSSNVYPGFDCSALDDFLCENIKLIHAYPEPDADSLKRLLAEHSGIDCGELCMTNGAAEAIYMIARAFAKCNVAIVVPTFSEYEDACGLNDMKLRFISSLDELDKGVQMVWLCNPNNPTGKWIDEVYIEGVVRSNPEMLFVIDRSYLSFTLSRHIPDRKWVGLGNVILIHSMTKLYAVPGLRMGYIMAHCSLIEKIEAFCIPWSMNALAIEAGKFMLLNPFYFKLDLVGYLNECLRLRQALSTISGVEVFDTDTHFFLCCLKNRTAKELKRFLALRHGILIRDASNFRGLNEGYVRIATQSRDENDKLIDAVRLWSGC